MGYRRNCTLYIVRLMIKYLENASVYIYTASDIRIFLLSYMHTLEFIQLHMNIIYSIVIQSMKRGGSDKSDHLTSFRKKSLHSVHAATAIDEKSINRPFATSNQRG